MSSEGTYGERRPSGPLARTTQRGQTYEICRPHERGGRGARQGTAVAAHRDARRSGGRGVGGARRRHASPGEHGWRQRDGPRRRSRCLQLQHPRQPRRPHVQPAAGHQQRRPDRRLLRLRRQGAPQPGLPAPGPLRLGRLHQRELPRRRADPGHRAERPRRHGRVLVRPEYGQHEQRQLRLLRPRRPVPPGRLPGAQPLQAARRPAARRQRPQRGRGLLHQRPGPQPRLRVQHRPPLVPPGAAARHPQPEQEGHAHRDRHQQRRRRGRVLPGRRRQDQRLLPDWRTTRPSWPSRARR